MKVKYIGATSPLVLTNGKEYNVLSIEKQWLRVIDDSGEDYLYSPELFEIIVSDWDDVEEILFDGTPEQIAAVKCPECGGELSYSYYADTRNMETHCKGSCGTHIRAHKTHYVPNFAKD